MEGVDLAQREEPDVVVEELLSLGLLPVAGGEVEDAAVGPVGEQAHHFAQVAFGLDVVKVAAGDERGEGGVDGCAVVATDEEPVLPADCLPAQLPLGDVVGCGQPAIGEETSQRLLLVKRWLEARSFTPICRADRRRAVCG